MIVDVTGVQSLKPDWVKREISGAELAILADLITNSGATIGAEIGVASGFSSAVLFAAMGGQTATPSLHSFDIAERCYFDPKYQTGAAFHEIHGAQEGFILTTGVTSADISALPPLDFLFIDANHATPWPALDVLSLGRFLKAGGWIALDDLDMLFAHPKFRTGKNGARDLYRVWKGPKAVYRKAQGLGLLFDVTPDILLQSVHHSLLIDWDVSLTEEELARFDSIAASYDTQESGRLRRALKSQRKSASNARTK